MLGSALASPDMDSPGERTDKIFAKMDTNSDGVLTKQEFVEGCMKDQFLYQMLTADAGGNQQKLKKYFMRSWESKNGTTTNKEFMRLFHLELTANLFGFVKLVTEVNEILEFIRGKK